MKRAAGPARMSCARSLPNERTATMPDVPSPLARRPAGRCLTAGFALLAGLAALATAPTSLAQSPEPAVSTSPAAPPAGSGGQAGGAVDEQVQSLKSDVLDLNRDLFVLEQELLYPANTQVAVFVSMDAG